MPGRFLVYRCGGCRALFYEPRLSPEELSRHYPPTYGRYRVSRRLDAKAYSKGLRRRMLESWYGYPSRGGTNAALLPKWVAALLSPLVAKDAIPYRGDGNFLDVGCGGGSYLYRLQQWGWNVFGVEPSPDGAAQARSLGLNVHEGELEQATFPTAFFDVVRLHHVLEHLSEPSRTLREIKRILRPNGVVYVTVPNTRSLTFHLFGSNWYGLDAPRHVISYSPASLKFLCDLTGFKVARRRCRSGPFIFVRSLGYLLQEKGGAWPLWFWRGGWPKRRAVRRIARPFFYIVDRLGWGDILVAELEHAKPSARDAVS